MRIDSPTNIRVTSDLSGSFSGSFFGDGSDIRRIDTANITLKNGGESAETTFQEQVQDIAGALIAQSDNNGIAASYNDASNTFAIENTTDIFYRVACSANGGTVNGGSVIEAVGLTDTLNIVAGSDIDLTLDTGAQSIKITGTAAPNNPNITLAEGTGISLAGSFGNTVFSLNQSVAETFTIGIDTDVVPQLSANNTFSGTTNTFNTVQATVFEGNGDVDTQITMTGDVMTFTAGGSNFMTLTEGGADYFRLNPDRLNIDIEMYAYNSAGGPNHRMFLLDASAKNLYMGNLSSSIGIDTSPPAVVNIVNDVADDKFSTNTADAHELLLVNFGNGSGIGNRGGSLAFTGAANGLMTDPYDGSNAFYAHAAIAGIQTTSDPDQVGLSFLRHAAGGYTSDMLEGMRLTHDGNLHVAADVIAFSSTVSDRRLKTNIQPLSGSLDKILQLNGKTFDWTTENYPSYTNTTHFPSGSNIGLIAQEVQEIVPEAIKQYTLPVQTGDEHSEYLTVQYDQLVPLLIESVKELQTQINELRDRLGDS